MTKPCYWPNLVRCTKGQGYVPISVEYINGTVVLAPFLWMSTAQRMTWYSSHVWVSQRVKWHLSHVSGVYSVRSDTYVMSLGCIEGELILVSCLWGAHRVKWYLCHVTRVHIWWSCTCLMSLGCTEGKMVLGSYLWVQRERNGTCLMSRGCTEGEVELVSCLWDIHRVKWYLYHISGADRWWSGICPISLGCTDGEVVLAWLLHQQNYELFQE